MDQLLANLPRPILAIGALLLGFVFIVLYDPPRTVCDAQMDLFREAQRTFLYARKEKSVTNPPLVKELYEICQGGNSPGACFDLFLKMKKLVVDLKNVPKQCAETAGQEPEVQQWIWKSMKLMAQIAWGERAPASYTQRNAWFDSSDIALFCDLQGSAIRMYGKPAFDQWRESVLTGLPQASQMAREQMWQKAIFSTACDSYR